MQMLEKYKIAPSETDKKIQNAKIYKKTSKKQRESYIISIVNQTTFTLILSFLRSLKNGFASNSSIFSMIA